MTLSLTVLTPILIDIVAMLILVAALYYPRHRLATHDAPATKGTTHERSAHPPPPRSCSDADPA